MVDLFFSTAIFLILSFQKCGLDLGGILSFCMPYHILSDSVPIALTFIR